MKTLRIFSLLFFLGVSALAGSTMDELKERFADRLPAIQEMWKEGLVGENNQGYLAPRGSLSDQQKKIVAEENADRKEVYQLIASRSDESAEQVGKQRAAQIAKQAAEGLWLQDSEGNWYKK